MSIRNELLDKILAALNAGGGGLVPSDNITGGWFNYEDNTTLTTPIAITAADGFVKITNDGLNPNSRSDFAPNGVTKLWDPVTNQFDFSELNFGDTVDLRLALNVTTASPNQEIDVNLFNAIGSGGEYEVPFVASSPKAAGLVKLLRFNTFFIGDANTRDFPGEFRISSDGNADVEVVGWLVRVIRRV